jgi:ABC-type spermidine/putrescine transport system permease subunit I
MGNMVAEPGREPTTQDRVARWWPVAIAISSTMVLPYLGIPFALVMAFLRRSDRPVMLALIGIAAFGVLLLSLFLGVGGGGVGTGR